MLPEPRFIVIGNAMPETVITATGRYQDGLGGVAGIMAQELLRQGEKPELIVPKTDTPQGRQLQALLSVNRLAHLTFPGVKPAWSRLDLRPGHKSAGHWPTIRWSDIRRILEERISDPHPNGWLLLECALDAEALAQAARHAAQYGYRVIVNGASPARAKRIPDAASKGGAHFHAVTLNRAETQAVKGDAKTPPEICRRLNAEMALLTRDRDGWELHTRDYGKRAGGAAIPLPAGAHAVGAGDAATAGLAIGLARDISVPQSIHRAVRDRLRHNQAS